MGPARYFQDKSVACIATNMMMTPETRNLARLLLAKEANAGIDFEATEPAAVRVFEKLSGHLCVLAGTAGFQSMASRALALARSDVPALSAVQLTADGKLQGMTEIESAMKGEMDRSYEAGVALISRLLQLLLLFVGEALTMRFVRSVWPDASNDDRDRRNGRNA